MNRTRLVALLCLPAIGAYSWASVLARDIDPLNVGVRTVNDVLWSVEHEAAHIAFASLTTSGTGRTGLIVSCGPDGTPGSPADDRRLSTVPGGRAACSHNTDEDLCSAPA